MDHWSVQPFNGQVIRASTIFQIARELKPSYVIETGTFKGTSTVWLAGLATKGTYTIEIDSLSASDARKRFSENYSDLPIQLIVGDSAEQIKEVLKNIESKTESVLAYLDAHWLDAIPTALEIEALVKWDGTWVAVIDDFYNPHDLNYGFDKYRDVVIGSELLSAIDGLEIWVSTLPAKEETGARRGTGYVFSRSAILRLGEHLPEDLIKIR